MLSGNQLINLDISRNPLLKYLSCDNNQLTDLNITKNTSLWVLGCQNNQLASLDISENVALTHVWLSGNNFTSLDVSKNTNLKYLYIQDMPSLTKVCVWQMPFPPTGVKVYSDDSPNVYYTSSDCNK